MEAVSLLTLWKIDAEDEDDTFFDIDFTVPIKRNNISANNTNNPTKTNGSEQVLISSLLARANSSSDSSKRVGKNMVRKYMKLIKPLYSKVSRFKIQEEIVSAGEKKSPLREVCRQLRKSRSASSGIGILPVTERRDDSLLQQDECIQSAILHCRTSYYSSRDSSIKSVKDAQRRISI